jgi:hypothetical protein
VSTVRLVRSAAALGLLALSCQVAAAAKTAPSYVDPYLDGLQPTVVALKGLLEAVEGCESRRLECGHVSDEALRTMAEQRDEVSRIDVIDVSKAAVAASPLPGAPIPLEFGVRRQRFLEAVFDYDLLVLSHYYAATKMCPSEGSSVNVPRSAERILRQFWELNDADRAATMVKLEATFQEHYKQLAASPADCTAVRELGHWLVAGLHQRSREFRTSQGKRPINRKLGLSVGSLWSTIAAFEIEAGNAHFIQEYVRDDLVQAQCTSVVHVSARCRSLILAPAQPKE